MSIMFSLVGLYTLCLAVVSAWTVPSKQGPNFGIINCERMDSSVKRFCLEQIQKRGMYPSPSDDSDTLSWLDKLTGTKRAMGPADDTVIQGEESKWNPGDLGSSAPEYALPSWQDTRPAAPRQPLNENELVYLWNLLRKQDSTLGDDREDKNSEKSIAYSRYKRGASRI